MKNSKRLTVAKSFQVCKDFLDLQQNFALIIKCVKMVQLFLKGCKGWYGTIVNGTLSQVSALYTGNGIL